MIQIYTRKDCHLCHVAEEVVAPIAADEGVSVELIDVDSDPALAAEFGEEVPVVFVGGRKAFKYRVDDTARLRDLIRRAHRREAV